MKWVPPISKLSDNEISNRILLANKKCWKKAICGIKSSSITIQRIKK